MTESVTLTAYRRRLATAMAGGAPISPLAFMAFGDAGHDASLQPLPVSDEATALNHEILRKPLTSLIQEDDLSVTGTCSIEANEALGIGVSEAAIVGADGLLVGIQTFMPKYKDTDERYEISIQLRY